MPTGDTGDFASFDFKINLSNSHVKHHFLFAPKIYIGDILPREQLQLKTQYSINMVGNDSLMEPLIAYVQDLKCNP